MRRFTALVFAAALFTSGNVVAQTAENWDQVIAAAKKEGQMVFYSGYIAAPSNKAIAESFTKKYGIKVEYLEVRGVELRERIRVEQVAGRHNVDVIHNAVTQAIAARDIEKIVQPYPRLPLAGRVKKPFEVTEWYTPIFTINYGFLINTNMLKGADEPTSWLDLLKPQYKGKILADDFRAAGGGYVAFFVTYDAFGREYHEKLAQQQPFWTRDYREAAKRVARGEYPIYIPYITSAYQELKGLPVKLIIPKEGASYGAYSVALVKNAPHPNAARLFMDHYLTDEGQEIYAREGHGIVVDGVAEKLPPEMQALANVKLLGTNTADRSDEMYAKAKEIYK